MVRSNVCEQSLTKPSKKRKRLRILYTLAHSKHTKAVLILYLAKTVATSFRQSKVVLCAVHGKHFWRSAFFPLHRLNCYALAVLACGAAQATPGMTHSQPLGGDDRQNENLRPLATFELLLLLLLLLV